MLIRLSAHIYCQKPEYNRYMLHPLNNKIRHVYILQSDGEVVLAHYTALITVSVCLISTIVVCNVNKWYGTVGQMKQPFVVYNMSHLSTDGSITSQHNLRLLAESTRFCAYRAYQTNARANLVICSGKQRVVKSDELSTCTYICIVNGCITCVLWLCTCFDYTAQQPSQLSPPHCV